MVETPVTHIQIMEKLEEIAEKLEKIERYSNHPGLLSIPLFLYTLALAFYTIALLREDLFYFIWGGLILFVIGAIIAVVGAMKSK
jgi:hypothetical protein